MVQLNNSNDYEHLCNVVLTKDKFPIAYENKVKELMDDCDMSREEAENAIKDMKIDANSYSTADEAIKEEMPCVNADDYYIRSFGFDNDEPNKKRGLRKGQIGYKGFCYPVAYIWSDFTKDYLMVADDQLWNDLKDDFEKKEEPAMTLDNEVFYYVPSLKEFENDEDALIDYIKKSTDLDFI